ncbi:hypothetical protein PGH45_06880 [Legionella pneumophila]|nr:hypothetical protein [Legionella pneumophila]
MLQRVLLVLLCFFFLASASDTVLKLYRPFGDVFEQAPPVVKKIMSGQCYEQSRIIIREDAWLCQAEGQLFDPCFVKAGSKKMEAVCPNLHGLVIAYKLT